MTLELEELLADLNSLNNPRSNAAWQTLVPMVGELTAEVVRLREAMKQATDLIGQREQRSHWQPIETAPDEAVLLLGWWCDLLGSKSWECEVEYYARDNGKYPATHWMSLPAPPGEEQCS